MRSDLLKRFWIYSLNTIHEFLIWDSKYTRFRGVCVQYHGPPVQQVHAAVEELDTDTPGESSSPNPMEASDAAWWQQWMLFFGLEGRKG